MRRHLAFPPGGQDDSLWQKSNADTGSDTEGIGAMIVTGSERAFAAGTDIEEMARKTPVQLVRPELKSAA